jgi:hypothetical protein
MNIRISGNKIRQRTAATAIITGLMLTMVSPYLAGTALAYHQSDSVSASRANITDAEGSQDMKEERARWRAEHNLTQLRLLLQIQHDRLIMADETVEHLLQLNSELEADDKDTSALTAAIEQFRTSVDEAWDGWDRANYTLSEAAGFDSEGKVTDLDQAKETLAETKDAMRGCRQTLQHAYSTLRRALRSFRDGLGRGEEGEGIR